MQFFLRSFWAREGTNFLFSLLLLMLLETMRAVEDKRQQRFRGSIVTWGRCSCVCCSSPKSDQCLQWDELPLCWRRRQDEARRRRISCKRAIILVFPGMLWWQRIITRLIILPYQHSCCCVYSTKRSAEWQEVHFFAWAARSKSDARKSTSTNLGSDANWNAARAKSSCFAT